MDEDRLRRHDLSDAEWGRLEPLLPRHPRQGHRWNDHRLVVAADAMVVRAHQHAAGARRQPPADVDPARLAPAALSAPVRPRGARELREREALGRSRGGLTSKIHLLADSGCRPLARLTSVGQRHDSVAFVPLMGQLAVARRGLGRPRARPGRVLGDKAYSSTAIRGHLRSRGIKATIPEPADQVKNRLRRGSRGGRPPAFDAAAYKQRNTVERAFCRLRQYRAVATRYDKRDYVWRGTVDVATIGIWLRHPVP